MKSLRRFLVVGCGGSGAATLAYMMDELKSQLASYGIHKLPSGWQFVDVDVPVTPQAAVPGVANVRQQGGTYIGLGVSASTYSQLDDASSRANVNLLQRFGPWALRDPEKWPVPISQGAGQVRAIGRMVAMNKFQYLRERLSNVWSTLQAGHDDMFEVASAMGVEYQQAANPLVLVVSSMAGGAGASMALDVARILATIPNYPVANVGMFLVAADVFDTLPENARAGVRPNSLAMLGEIVAAQTGAATKSDLEDLTVAGIAAGSGTGAPFRRVFPISANVGEQQTPFGQRRPQDVYRGLARGLAALMTSASATAQYENFDLANVSHVSMVSQPFGWDESALNLEWGSFGYCALSMGRERYAEYSAQRLARGTVDSLLDGHMRVGTSGEDGATVLNRLRSASWSRIKSDVGLYETQDGQFKAWLSEQVWSRRETSRVSLDLVAPLMERVPPADGQDRQQWLAMVESLVRQEQSAIAAQLHTRVHTWLWPYQQTLVDVILEQVRAALAQYGVPHALDVLDAIGTTLGQMSSLAGGEPPLAFRLTVPEKVFSTVAALGRGRVLNGLELLKALRENLAKSVQPQLYAQLAADLSQIWRDCADNLVQALVRELSAKHNLLERERRTPATQAGVAVVATSEYGLWPTSGRNRVPDRFDHAVNEVLITSSKEYLDQFDRDISRAFGHEVAGSERDAWPKVTTGDWLTGDGSQPPGGLLTVSAPWTSRLFDTDPISGDPLVSRPAEISVQIRSKDILDRARLFVGRREMSFAQFSDESLSKFVHEAPQQEVDSRRELLLAKFRQSLDAALPLAGLSSDVVKQLVPKGVQYRYKFSEIPFLTDSILTGKFRQEISGRPTVDAGVVLGVSGDTGDDPSGGTFGEALGMSSTVRRIDVFGSYPCYLPICFSSVTEPIRQQWASSSTSAKLRREFWEGRRARPLPASLPMGDEERRAMIGGWFVGQIVGKVEFNDVHSGQEKEIVRVWDNEDNCWRSFPELLLTPYLERRRGTDLLPSILESYLLAVVNAGAGGAVFDSLRPYRALRSLFDAGETGRTHQGYIQAESEFASIIRGDHDFQTHSRVTELSHESGLEARGEAIQAWLDNLIEIIRDLDHESRIQTRRDAAERPLLMDLRDDLLIVLPDLRERVDAGMKIARSHAAKSEPRRSPAFDRAI